MDTDNPGEWISTRDACISRLTVVEEIPAFAGMTKRAGCVDRIVAGRDPPYDGSPFEFRPNGIAVT
jgi:hypothetical protein